MLGRLGRKIFIANAEMLARAIKVVICGCVLWSKNRAGSKIFICLDMKKVIVFVYVIVLIFRDLFARFRGVLL